MLAAREVGSVAGSDGDGGVGYLDRGSADWAGMVAVCRSQRWRSCNGWLGSCTMSTVGAVHIWSEMERDCGE